MYFTGYDVPPAINSSLLLYIPSSLVTSTLPILDLGSEAVHSNGISGVEFTWISAGALSALSLEYNDTTQQVVLLTTDPTIFNSSLFQAPVLFTMKITDGSPQCVAHGAAPIFGSGCSSSFVVSMLALTEIGCPASVDTVVSYYGNTTQTVVWNAPSLLYFLPLSSSAQPGDVFPLGSTSVTYSLAPSVQSVVQTELSRLMCEFNVCALKLVALCLLRLLFR